MAERVIQDSCYRLLLFNPFSANSVDPDETAHNEQFHLDIQCLLFGSKFLTEHPICNNGSVQSQSGRVHLRNSEVKGLRPFFSQGKTNFATFCLLSCTKISF